MKKIFFGFLLSICIFSQSAFAKDLPKAPDTYNYDMLVSKISGVKAPYVSGDYIVFTSANNARSIGISFDFENFKKIHYFNLHKTRNFEGEVTESWYFYVLEKPKKTNSISYRLIIDGLWTVDPNNKNTYFDTKEGILLSYITIPEKDPEITEIGSEYTHFVCFAEPGQNIRLGGTFTNWDSWIYTMKEIVPGRYELDIPLPAGTYYYSYFVGMSSFLDKTNPQKGYSSDGKVVSCITVK